jgi:hypothetical protein
MALNLKPLMALEHPGITHPEAEVAMGEVSDQKDSQHREHSNNPKDGLNYLCLSAKDLEIKKKLDEKKKLEQAKKEKEEKEANIKKLDILE